MSTTPLSAASAWQPGPAGGHITADWAQGRAAFGGLLATGALRAARGVVPADRRLRSALVDFIGPASAGPVDVEVEVLREGRSLTRVEIRALQEGALCAVVLASYGADRPTALPWPGEAPPQVPGPAGRQSMPFLKGVTPEFTQHFDYRWTVDSYPFTGQAKGHVQGWVQVREDPAPVTAEAIPSLLDSWPPPIWSRAKRPFPGSSVTWQINLLGPLPPEGAPADAWWLYDAHTVMAADGYSDFSARLWDAEGRLVATSRQLFAEFSGRV